MRRAQYDKRKLFFRLRGRAGCNDDLLSIREDKLQLRAHHPSNLHQITSRPAIPCHLVCNALRRDGKVLCKIGLFISRQAKDCLDLLGYHSLHPPVQYILLIPSMFVNKKICFLLKIY